MLRVKRRGPVFAVGVGVLALSLLVPGFAAQATDGDGASPVDGLVVQPDPVDNEAGGCIN